MTSKQRKSGGINLSGAFATAGASILKTAESSMPAYAQHVADTAEIAPNPLNERDIDPHSPDIQRLAKSLKADGQLQAVPVVPRADFLAWEGFGQYAAVIGNARYVVIGGGRRRAAAEVAGLPRMDISIKSGLTREAFLRITLVENIEREDLTPLQEARQIQRLREATGESYTQIGALLNGRTKGWVAQRLDLLKLSARLQAELASDAEGSMTTTQARRLLKMIRDEAGEHDDATVSAERQWALWNELRRSIDRLPGKQDEEAAATPRDRLPGKRDDGPASTTTAVEPATRRASKTIPAQPTFPPRDDQGSVLIRVSSPAAEIAQILREKFPQAKWDEFVAAVNAT